MILGGPASGKTHLGGQLYGRLQRAEGRWRIGRTPADLSIFAEVLNCLDRGLAATHTSINTFADLSCPIEREDGEEVELQWPDYGGEQFESILSARTLPEGWAGRLKDASGWLLLLRPSRIDRLEDRLDRRASPDVSTRQPPATAAWDIRAQLVEILQIILSQTGSGLGGRRSVPRLAVLLSCWDELTSPSTPADELRLRLPLVQAFLESHWDTRSWSVWGLSSLGRALDVKRPDTEFCNLPPEERGYVLPPGADHPTADLTLPIDWLIGGVP